MQSSNNYYERIKPRLYLRIGRGLRVAHRSLRNAVTIGLLPDLPRDRFRFVGNASLQGAKMALLAREHIERLTGIARNMTYVELSMEPRFMDRYVASLFLPHTDETLFPSVIEEVPDATVISADQSNIQ